VNYRSPQSNPHIVNVAYLHLLLNQLFADSRAYNPVIEISGITKRYQALVAINNVSLTIRSGEVLGVLGPNGAGKTTLFRLITGSLNPDSGHIRALDDRWPNIGYKPERLLFPSRMRVHQYLEMIASLSNLDRRQSSQAVESGLATVDLLGAAEKRVSECSKGMRQRLALAQAMVGNPPLLLLDEPSNGLDPEGQADICRLIKEMREGGRTIVLASHQLSEVTQVCSRLVIINKGSIHYEGSMRDALAERPHATIRVDRDLSSLAPLLSNLHPDIEIDVDNRETILNHDAIALRPQVLSILLSAGYDITHIQQSRVTLAEIYAEAVS
jgi:ABC-2 type transport system ATP-binding protein